MEPTATLFLLALTAQQELAVTLYLASDSTMAHDGGGTGTNGWGEYIHSNLSIPIVNLAVAGRSARSYTREGRFTNIINLVKAGDFIIIEFGHNDGGSLTPTDNGRSDCSGTGTETCKTVYNGVSETVKTFPAYLEAAAKSLKAKGATVIISFAGYAKLAASAAGATYVDHGAYIAARYKALGRTTVDSYFPNDHTHTSPAGASVR